MARTEARCPAIGVALLLTFAAGACTPPTLLPGCTIATCGWGWTAAERKSAFQDLVRDELAEQQHVNDVAFPLILAAAPFCAPAVMPRNGLFFLNVTNPNETYRDAFAGIGLNESLSVVGVTKHSGAERAGIRAGDRLLTIAGKAAPVGKDAVALAIDQTVQAYLSEPAISIGVRRDSSLMEFRVPADTGCTYAVTLAASGVSASMGDEFNAWVGANTIFITREMQDALTDRQLSVLVAHQIAHGTMHLDAITNKASSNAAYKNVLAGTANVLLGAVLFAGALVGGRTPVGDPFIHMTNTKSQLAHVSYSQPRERDADVLSQFLLARAGETPSAAGEFWRRVTTSPKDSNVRDLSSSLFNGNHKTDPARYTCLSEALTEVEHSRTSSPALVPPFTSIDSASSHTIVLTALPAACQAAAAP